MSLTPHSSYYSQSSERLSFRVLSKVDIQLWVPFFDDNSMLEYLGMATLDHLSSEEKSASWIDRQIERQNNGDYGQLAVIDKATNTLIGVGGIIARDLEGVEEYEITYSLMPSSWGKGFATELAVHFKEYARNILKLDSAISIIHIDNEASINVAIKNNMVKERDFEFMEMPVSLYRTNFK